MSDDSPIKPISLQAPPRSVMPGAGCNGLVAVDAAVHRHCGLVGRPPAAAFIDKDGTLVEDVPFNVDPGLLRFTPRAVEGLSLLAAQGYQIVVVTNQPGIALGLFDASHEGMYSCLAHHRRPYRVPRVPT